MTNNLENIDLTIASDLLPKEQITQPCFDWCVEQHVVHTYNVDMTSIAIIGFSFIMHSMYFLGEEYEFFRKNRNMFIYISRLTIVIFFVYYFFYIKWGLIP